MRSALEACTPAQMHAARRTTCFTPSSGMLRHRRFSTLGRGMASSSATGGGGAGSCHVFHDSATSPLLSTLFTSAEPCGIAR